MENIEYVTSKKHEEKGEAMHPPFNLFRASMVLSEVIKERERQHAKWGQQEHTPFVWLSILTEEVGEAAKEANEALFSGRADGKVQADAIANLRTELIQVAAVAAAIVEDIDNRGLDILEQYKVCF